MNLGAWTTRLACLQRTLLISAAAGLVACGGGSDNEAPPAPKVTQLMGTVAIGAPVAGGAVQVRCMGGDMLETITKADGTWQVETTGKSLPCGLRVTGGTLAAGQALHSVALAFANVNITPLTDLIMANALGKLPSVWWGVNGPADFAALNAAQVDKSLAALRTAFALPVLQSFDPRVTGFKAVPKDAVDDVLEALRLALANFGTDYASVLAAASNVTFSLSDGFRISLGDAYSTITVGGVGTGGGGGGTGDSIPGNFTLTLNVVAAGISVPPVIITNIPKPSTQEEFCNSVNDASSPAGLNQAIPAGTGSLTINSCTFNGTTGQISATLTITSPTAITIPYSVTYTYN